MPLVYRLNKTNPILNQVQSLLEKHKTYSIFKPPLHFYLTAILGFILFFGPLSSLLEGVWIFLTLITNGGLVYRESRLAATEMKVRLQDVVDLVEKHGMSETDEIHFSSTKSPSVAVARVMRDGKSIILPCNLLAEGDTVLLGIGDRAPCSVSLFSRESVKLERGQILKPSLISDLVDSDQIESNNLLKFKVLETPIQHIIETAFNSEKPETVMGHYGEIVESLATKLSALLLVLAMAVNLCRLFLVYDRRNVDTYTVLGRLQVYAVLPLLPITFPTLHILTKSYANAYILTLFEALQSSKTVFEDKEDVDEFDYVPAPTKEFHLSWSAISKKLLDQVIKLDGTRLARMDGLVDSLANCTVLCAVDREGTIASALPAVDQLLLLSQDDEPVVLDLNYDMEAPNGVRFEDSDWSANLKLLKPFGLSTFLTTECGVVGGRRRNDLHFKSTKLASHSIPNSSRHACICHVGREIGFSAESFTSMSPIVKVETFAPYHDVVEALEEYHFEVPSLTSVIVAESVNLEMTSCQVFSDGNLDLIVDSCGDFWNGEELKPLTEPLEKKIFEFAQNAVISDLQVVGFSYRPIQNPTICGQMVGMKRTEPYYFTIPDQKSPTKVLFESPVSEIIRESIRESSGVSKVRKRSNRERMSSRIDTNLPISKEKDLCMEVTKGQTFLCAASFVYPPKVHMVDFVEDLGLAGIRFVFFSRAPERESKAYAERLGLEIDWNSCIILSPDNGTGGGGYLAIHDNKAKLPRGVETIRNHIANVDDVPLHVSLFAECKPPSIREMIKIFQEAGEVVCCIGSSLNDSNVECYANADVSIAMDPIPLHRHKLGSGPVPPLLVSALFNAVPCALTLHADASLYSITQMIREARCLAENGRQAFSLFICIHLCLSSIVFLSYCCFIPQILEGYQIMFVVWILLPILASSLLFTPHQQDIMTQIPAKNLDHQKDLPRFFTYYSVRCLVPSFSCILINWL